MGYLYPLHPGEKTEFYRAYITRPSGKQDYCEFSYDPRDGSTLINHVEADGDTSYRVSGSSPETNLSTWLQGKAERLASTGEMARGTEETMQQIERTSQKYRDAGQEPPREWIDGKPVR
jgi:hypothetical protein